MSKILEQINNVQKRLYVIKDIGRVVTGKTPSKDNPEYWGNNIDFITPTDFSDDSKYLKNIKRKISEDGSFYYKNMIIPAKSIIVTCIGSDMGKVVISRNQALTNQQINSIIVDLQKFDIDYSYYLLKSMYPTLRSVAEEGGSTMPIITKSVFEKIEFEAPDLPTQKKIASILGAYDKKIENNNKIIKNLEATAQTIFNEWFVNFKFPGYEKVKMIESEMGEIPEGWKIKKISKLFTIILGGTPSREKLEYWNGNIPWINSGEINKLRILEATEHITELGLNKSNARLIKSGATVLAITGATLGQVSRLEIDSTANQSVIGIYDENNILNEYLYLYILSNIHDLISGASGGAQQHINKQIVENYEILIPSDNIIKDFNKKIISNFLLIKKLFEENISLKSQRNLLLAKLI
jgi:type I restriction enzyme S subunit